MLRIANFENFSFACLIAAASLALAASALAYSVPRAPLDSIAIGQPELVP